jgi:hypothetical protein
LPGEYEYSRQGEILKCPWHSWEFDIRTGQSWFDPARVRVRQYDVTVAPAQALLDREDSRARSRTRPVRRRDISGDGRAALYRDRFAGIALPAGQRGRPARRRGGPAPTGKVAPFVPPLFLLRPGDPFCSTTPGPPAAAGGTFCPPGSFLSPRRCGPAWRCSPPSWRGSHAM